MIIEDDFDPVPEHTSAAIKMLIYSLLHKDQVKRPSVWELAHIKCIKDQLNIFVKENDCAEQVSSLISLEKSRASSNIPVVDISKAKQGGTSLSMPKTPKTNTKGAFTFGEDMLEEIAKSIQNDVDPETVKIGFLKKFNKAYSGRKLLGWVETHYPNKELPLKIMKDLLDLKLLLPLLNANSDEFLASNNAFYYFQFDKETPFANKSRIFQGEARDALIVSIDLIRKANIFLLEFRKGRISSEQELQKMKSFHK